MYRKNENAAKNIGHRIKAQRGKGIMSTPENVRLREEAAARCTAKIKRRVLRKQARKARAEHQHERYDGFADTQALKVSPTSKARAASQRHTEHGHRQITTILDTVPHRHG